MSLTLKGAGIQQGEAITSLGFPGDSEQVSHFEAPGLFPRLTIILENEHTKTNVLRFLIPTKCVHHS